MNEEWNQPNSPEALMDCECYEYSADCYCVCHDMKLSHKGIVRLIKAVEEFEKDE